MSSYEKDKAREHWNKSKDDVSDAGQHAASAARTVGHDVRAAAGQAAEAGKHAGRSLTAPARESGEYVRDNVDRAADRTEREAKSTYNKIKDSIGGFFGQAKETGDDVARRADDAVHRTANQANRGVDKVRETRRDFHQSAPSAGQVQDKGEEALESSKDAAVQAKDTVVGGLSYIGGRLMAPVSGDEGKDKEVADKAKANVNRGADKLSNANQETRDTAVEAKEQTKGFFSGVFGGNSGDEEAQKKGKNLKDKASDTLSDAEDKVRDTYDSTKESVRDTYNSTKANMRNTYDNTTAKLREAAESVEPHNNFEAIKASGGIPSNTADLLKARSRREQAAQQEHETIEGMNVGTSDFLSKTASAWNDGMTGEGTLGSVRAAADGAGPHASWK